MIVAGDNCCPLLPLLVVQLVVEAGNRQILVPVAVVCRQPVVWVVWSVVLIEVLLRLERLLAAAALVRLP